MANRKRTKGQTTQWPIEKGQKDRQHNGRQKKDKSTDNDLQNITQKTEDRATLTPLKAGGEPKQGYVASRLQSSLQNSSVVIMNWLTVAKYLYFK